MVDRVSKEIRSEIMRKIRSRGNRSTERRFRALLVQAGVSGWRMHPDDVTGCPDFIFPNIPMAVFVDGCFWHGCPKCYRRPKSRREYWGAKVLRNMNRDRDVDSTLNVHGYKVLRIWEHELDENPSQFIANVKSAIERHQASCKNKP